MRKTLKTIRDMLCGQCHGQYYIKRIKQLSEMNADNIHCIYIPPTNTTVEPRRVFGKVTVADRVYETFPATMWRTILTALHTANELTYTKSICDCDDFALVFSAAIAKSAYNAGHRYQPAFGIAWSDTHAFNVFIDDTNRVHIYEPQNDMRIIEKSGNYDYNKVWFMS